MVVVVEMGLADGGVYYSVILRVKYSVGLVTSLLPRDRQAGRYLCSLYPAPGTWAGGADNPHASGT